MALAGSKVIQRIDVHHKSSNIDGISWSQDNRLAVVTNSFVTIINITGAQTDEKKKESRLSIKRTAIAVDHKAENIDVGVDFSMYKIDPLGVAPYYSTAMIDPALTPTILKQTPLEDVTYAKWSPVGCDRTGRSVLAVLFRTNKLSLYIADKRSLHGWCESTDLSKKHVEEMETEQYFKDKSNLKGELPVDERRALGNKKTWKDFEEWQRRKYLLNFTSIEWFPATVSCLQQANNTMRKFAYLATMVKSGQLLVWQAQLPLVKNHSFIYRAVAAYTSMFYPSCLAWYGKNGEQASYLACGNTDGIIKVFLVKIVPTNVGIPNISIVKAYSFCDNPDGVCVDCMKWYRKDNKLYLACSKGPQVYLFHTQLMQGGGALSSPAKQVITGVHLLNVTGIAISPSGMLFSTSAEGSVQKFQIGSRVPSTVMDCETLAGHGYTGVSVSPNGVFMALYESKRKLFHYKKGATAVEGEIVILSLVPNEENVRELMSNASSVVDVASIRNRFIYQELFKADLSDAMTLPSDLSSFSHPYLQFLWNLFSTHPKFVKRSGHALLEVATNNDKMSAEQTVESQILCCIEKIEMQVATSAMEKALKFVLEYHEGKQRLYNTPVSGDITIKSLCHWLAERNPSTVIVDLLGKVWALCSPELSTNSDDQGLGGTPMNTDVCQEILRNNVTENCMCGHPIALKEVRFGRCEIGHVWPRCCVTFKLLDGTNARVCENCNAHALNRHPINSPYEDWTKLLLDVTSSCTYCGAWFEEV